MAQLANQVQQENMQKAAQQEAELAGLQAAQINQEEYDRQQVLAGAASAAGTAMSLKDREQMVSAATEKIQALQQQILDLTQDEQDDLLIATEQPLYQAN